MQQSSKYTWSYIRNAMRSRSARLCTSMRDSTFCFSLSTFPIHASDWQNPPFAPPIDPLKYGTPQRYNFMGDAGWNPI